MPTTIAETSQAPLLVVTDGTPIARIGATSQMPLLAVVDAYLTTGNTPRTSQEPLLVVYNTGGRENFKLRAWPFRLDGNWYYVLHLGVEGTWVYCRVTDTWAQWETMGFGNWNAEQGVVWNERIIVGDNQNGILWEADPELMVDDDFRPISRVVTGLLAASSRQRITVDSLYITASVGYPTSLDPLVSLSFSDDYGQTWVDMIDCDVTLINGDYTQEIAFRQLGSFAAPGRVFKVSDVGGAVRIDRAYVNTRGPK